MFSGGFLVIAAKVKPLLGFGIDIQDTHLITVKSVDFWKGGNARWELSFLCSIGMHFFY